MMDLSKIGVNSGFILNFKTGERIGPFKIRRKTSNTFYSIIDKDGNIEFINRFTNCTELKNYHTEEWE